MYIYIMSKTLLILSLFSVVFFFGIEKSTSQNIANEKQHNTLKQPPYLKTGDTVAIIAPSGILKNRTDEVQQAQALLNSWGLNSVLGKHVFSKADHFAGTDDERCEDLQEALDNPKISAIWCARGGYGTVRILDKLDYSTFKQNPKWLIGESEIEASISTFKNTLFGTPLSYILEGSNYNKTGTTSGQLVGGNLTMIHTLLGSKTSINTSGKILFIEEIGEYKYHIDRMLQSLKRAGYFDNCKGLIVGDMTKLRTNTTLWGTSVEQLILDALSDYDFPIAFNMPAGHEKDNQALILGRTIQLVVSSSQSSILFN